jgi:hypothetical protein
MFSSYRLSEDTLSLILPLFKRLYNSNVKHYQARQTIKLDTSLQYCNFPIMYFLGKLIT